MRTYVHVVSTKCSVNQILKTNIFTSVKRLLGRPVPQRHMSAWWCGLCVLCTIPGGKTNLPLYSDYPAGIRRISVLPAILWRTSCGLLTVIRRMSSGRIMGFTYRPHTQTAAVVSAPRKRRGKPLIFSGPLKMKVWPIFQVQLVQIYPPSAYRANRGRGGKESRRKEGRIGELREGWFDQLKIKIAV